MRRLATLALASALLSACSSQVDPTNPWDPATPDARKAKATIRGVIRAGGVAAALVPVRLRQNGREIDSTFSLDDGGYVFRDLVPGAYVVEAERSGFQKYVYPVSLAAGQQATLDGDLTLLSGVEAATLKGFARLQDQFTHGGILVEVLDPTTSETLGFTGITASDGKYQLSVPSGTYDLRFLRTDFTNKVQTGVVALAGAETDVPDVQLAVNPATVSGQVVAETIAGGVAPLLDATVTLQGSGSSGLTDAQGNFSFNNVVPGSYLLRVVKAGYLEASVPVIGLEGGEVRVLDEALVLPLARGSITGTVQLADNPDASGVIVEATGTGVATVTGASGAFQLPGLVEGTYEVTLRKDGYAPAVRAGVVVTSGAAAGVGTVTLARQGGTIAVIPSAVTQSRSITVQLNATSATGYRISQDPTFADPAQGDTLTSPASPRPYSGPGSTHAFTLDDLDGRHELYVIFYDGVTASTPASTSVVLDRQKPSGASVLVEGGAGYTRNTVVGLTLSAQDLPPAANVEVSGLATMELANNPAFTGATSGAFAVSSTWSIGAGDGPKTVWVRFTDKAGNVSDPASATIVLDTTAPTAPSVALTGGAGSPAGFTGSPLVTAALAATDANAGAAGENLQVKLSNSSGLGGASWQPFSASVPFFVTAGDGLKTVYAQFMDPAGNTSVVANGTITLAATPPSAGTLVVEGGAEATSKTTVNVAVSATGAAQMRFFVNGTAATGWIAYAPTGTVALGAAPDEAVATVSVNFRNTALVEGGSASASIVVDRRAPVTPAVLVNANAPFAGATAVTLSLSADDTPAAAGGLSSGLARVEVSNSATFSPLVSFAYGATVPWTLASGDGAKTVYVRFVDGAGNVSTAANDAIVLDTTPPGAPTLALAGNPEAQAGTTGTPIVTATLSATDANEGVGKANLEVRVSNDLGFAASSWQPYAASTAWVLAPGDGPKTVYAQFRDRAGNVSATATGTITLAGTPPTSGSVVVEGGAPATNKTTVAVALSASGASQMRLFRNGTAATSWITYATSTSVDVSGMPDETPVVIAASFRNTGGAEGGGASASILIDRRAPTLPAVSVNAGAAYASGTAAALAVSAVDAPLTTGTASGLDRVEVANNSAFTGSTLFAYAPTLAWTLPAGDGAKTVYVRFVDKAGNVSTSASDAIVLDATAPAAPTIALAGNPEAQAGTTGTPIVTATLSATDANGGAGNANLEVRVSNDLGFAASSWQPFAATTAWVLAPGDGTKTVYAQFRDPAGNVSSTASATITLAGTPPSSGTLAIEGGAAATNKGTLALALSAVGATQMRLFVNGVAATGWVAYATTSTVGVGSLPDETPAAVAVSFRNAGGVEGGAASASILVDRRAPTAPAVSVNAGAAFAASTAVTLTLSATEAPLAGGAASGLDRVEIANNATFTGSTFLPFAASAPWTLPAGDGAKTVYVRFLDKAGNVSPAANDGITLDGTAPGGTAITLTGNPEAQAGTTGTSIVTATLAATDANGGAGSANLEVQLSNSSSFTGASWQPFAAAVTWVLAPGDGAKTVYAQFRDPAGNVSTPAASANITLATAAPSSGTIVVEGGAAATNKATLAVALSAAGATQMRLTVNGVAAAGWVAYATSATVSVAGLPDETPAAIGVSFRGPGGVEGGAASTSILVDRRAPTAPAVSVNAGAAFAAGTGVTLNVSATEAPLAGGAASGLDRVEVANNSTFTGSTFFPFADALPWTLVAGDGVKTVYVRFLDRAGNVSAAANDAITLDGTAPSATTLSLTGNPEASAGNTGTPIVTANLAATDANGGAGNVALEVQLSNSSSFTGASWQPFASSVAWVLPPGDGTKTVYARFRDPAGNVSTPAASGTVNLVATPPSSGSLVIAGGADATSTQTVALAISATGATQMRLFVNGVAATAWIAYATSTSVDLGASPNEATRVVSVGFRNAGGVEGGGTSASIRFDTVAPGAGTLAVVGTLGNGSTSATLTATPAVVLQLAPPTGVTDVAQMALAQATTSATACSTMFGAPQWQPAALSATFVLTGTDGAKRACVLFRDGAGNFAVANAVAANITLDTTPPTNPAFVNVTSTTQNVAFAPRTGNPTITAASDVNGVTYQCVGGFAPGYGSQWTDCGAATTLPRPWTLLTNSENTLGVRARDAAYNYSPGSFVRIVHDDVAPTPPFIVDLRASRDAMTVTWDTTADADVVDYAVYYGNAAGDLSGTGAAQGPSPVSAGPRYGQATGAFTLTGLTQGIPYYVAVEAVDAAGNRSGPSGQRAAVPNRANPRTLSSVAAMPRVLGWRTTVSKSFLYVGTNQGITQLDMTTEGSPAVTGRAFLPDTVPVERAHLAVLDCTSGAVAGHCVIPTGTTLEGDYRGDYDYYRAAAPVVFFPLTGSATNPVVGTIQSILPSRPTHVVAYVNGGVTYIVAVDQEGVRVFTLGATNPSLVRQVARTTHAAPVLQVMDAGLNGSELYVLARVDSRYFGGPADYPLVFGYELADVVSGDVYALFAEHGLQSNTGAILGDTFAGGQPPVFIVDRGVYAMYYSASGDTVVSSYNPAASAPVSTAVVYTGASSDGGYPAAGASGANQLFLWTEGGLGSPTVRQVTVSGFTLTAGGQLSSNNEPYSGMAAVNHLGATRLFTLEASGFDPSQRSIRRWDVNGSVISAPVTVQEQPRTEYFAGADGVLYLSQLGSINTVDVSNPYLPRLGTAFSSTSAVRTFSKVVAHGRFLYAALGPAVFGGGQQGGVGIFRMLDNGGLQRGGTILNPTPLRTAQIGVDVTARDLAVVGRWLFVTGSDGALRAFDLTAGGVAGSPNNPATSIPTAAGTLAGSFDRIAARKDTSGTNYEAVVYAVVNRAISSYGYNGATFTLLGTSGQMPTSATVTAVELAGNHAVVSTNGGSYLFNVSSGATASLISNPAVYPVSGPAKLQAGYVVGLAAGGDPSGPAFVGRNGAGSDGSLRFATCAPGSGGASLFHEDGLYAASCQRNGMAIFATGALEGMKLLKSFDLSPTWTNGAAFSTDGMLAWTGGPTVWNGSANDSSRLYTMDESSTAEGSNAAPLWTTNVSGGDILRGASFMVHSDGVVYVLTSKIVNAATLDAYEATSPYTFLGRYTFVGTDPPAAMVTDGDYAYVARNGTNTQVDVIDIRNPAAMALRASSGAILNRNIANLTLNRDRLFAGLYQGSAQVHEIRVWDTSAVQSTGTLTAAGTVNPAAEGSITGVAVSGSTIFWTVHDPVFRAPLFGYGIGTLGANRDGTGFAARVGSPFQVAEPLQSPVISGDVVYAASNLGVQSWDLRAWWASGGNPVPGGAVSLADPLRLNAPVKLQIEGPFGYLVGGTVRSFDLR